jgi:hypothetical protein
MNFARIGEHAAVLGLAGVKAQALGLIANTQHFIDAGALGQSGTSRVILNEGCHAAGSRSLPLSCFAMPIPFLSPQFGHDAATNNFAHLPISMGK